MDRAAAASCRLAAAMRWDDGSGVSGAWSLLGRLAAAMRSDDGSGVSGAWSLLVLPHAA